MSAARADGQRAAPGGSSTSRPRARGAGEHGQAGFVAGAEALIFGVLIFVIGTLVVVNAWGVIDAKFATSAAAREAVRSVVEAEPGSNLDGLADAAARATVTAHGRDAGSLTVTPLGAPTLERCAEIAYRVESQVSVVSLPLVQRGVGVFTVSSVHRELVDPFRSGIGTVGEEASCDL